MFGFGRKTVAAEIVGNNMSYLILDADDCWKDVCALRSYDTPGPIAVCEMAFARAALMMSILGENQKPSISERISNASKSFLLDVFSNEDSEVTKNYYGLPMSQVAPERLHFYSQHVFPVSQLALVLGIRLGVPGAPLIEAAFMFESVEQRIRLQLAKLKIV